MKSTPSIKMIMVVGLLATACCGSGLSSFLQNRCALGRVTADESQDEIRELIGVFSGSEWEQVSKAQFALVVEQGNAIPALVDLLQRDEQVKLENTADLIYPSAETFYGHGGILNYDIDWLSVRAGWALDELTFEDFGFSERSVNHDELLRTTKARKTDVPLREVAPIATDAATRKKQRLQAIQRAKHWWERSRGVWQRLTSLITALESEQPTRVLTAIQWIRFGETPIDGFSQDVYAARIFPIVKRLAGSADKSVADQAGHLVRSYEEKDWGWLESKKEVELFLRTHPLTAAHLIRPDEIHSFLESERAWELCQRLNGYKTLRESFEIESATIGCVNLLPDSLHVGLRTTNRGLINGVWWWSPVDENGKPQFDWNDLINVHGAATAVLSKHTWLAEWRETSFGREVELHALGDGIAAIESDLKVFVLPLWRDAGLRGDPAFSVLARRGDTEWAQVYFGKDEARALITAVSHPDWKAKHWLDRLDVYFHPKGKPGDRSSRYVVVEPAGKWEVRTYRAPGP